MNLLDALTIVRNCSLRSAQMHTKQGKAALKVIEKKLQSLMRKKAWREGVGAIPIHMADPDFTYPIQDTHPDTAKLKEAEALLAYIDSVSPRADFTCAEPGITFTEACRRQMQEDANLKHAEASVHHDAARAQAGKEGAP